MMYGFSSFLHSVAWLQDSTAALFIVLAVFGLIVGSFLNVVIYRLPIMLNNQWRLDSAALLYPDQAPQQPPAFNLLTPGSTCPACQDRIRWWQNIPVLSYLILRGRCAACRHPIAPRYPIIETTSAVIAVLVGWQFGASWPTLMYCGLAWSLLALAVIDYDTQLLPDPMTLPLLWAGLVVNSFDTSVSLQAALWGAVAGYLVLWSVYWLFKWLTGKEGMGYGDFKLLAALGAWLGWSKLPLIILLASLVGTLVTLSLIALGRQQRAKPVPFGPYLAGAGFITALWGDSLGQYYLQIMSL